MQHVKLDPEKFEAKQNTVVRFWNDLEQRAQAHNQANQELKESCKYIFVRNDGWSIASPEYESAHNLWPDEWSYCFVLKGSNHVVKDWQLGQGPTTLTLEVQASTPSMDRLEATCEENTDGNVTGKKYLQHVLVTALKNEGLEIVYAKLS